MTDLSTMHYDPYPHFPAWTNVPPRGAVINGRRVYDGLVCRECDAWLPAHQDEAPHEAR